MNVTKRNFNVSVKLSKNFDSIAFSEGFEYEMDNETDKDKIEEDFESEKRRISQKVYSDSKEFINGLMIEKSTGHNVMKNGKIDIDVPKIDLEFKKGNEVN